MADTNERKRRVLDCPLFKLIEETWIDYDSKISSFSIGDEDVFRYTLWCIEGLKDNSGDRERHEDKMRALLFKLIRKGYGAGSQPKDLDLLVDIIMAYTLECLEWAQTADWTSFMSLYDKVSDSIASNKEPILTYKKEFNNIVFEKDLCHSFKQWIVDYMTNDEFLTDEDGAWIVENGPVIDASANDSLDSNTFEMTEEDWVLRYNPKITSKYKENKYLIDKIKKLRESYLNAIHQPERFNRTGFLRDNIFWPKTAWLYEPNVFPAEAIRDMFNDTKFTDKTVSKAKKKN